MKFWWVGLVLLLAGCLPSLQAINPQQMPSANNWGPNSSPLEWWYVSGYLPEEGLAFHWAIFKAYSPQNLQVGGIQAARLFPGPFHASHIALTDLKANRKLFEEKFDFSLDRTQGDSVVRFSPLYIQQENWKLVQEGDSYRLEAGPIQVRLTPLKPAVVHPPGYSGTAETGLMYYVSFTRLRLEGSIAGRKVQGQAWMDHQWGDQIGIQGSDAGTLGARWDWFGLHLSGGEDLMLYRVKNRSGEVVQVVGTVIDAQGRVRSLDNLRMIPLETWTSPSGRSYALSWQIEAEGLRLRLDPLRQDQELLTTSTRVAYWEGAVSGVGTWQGQPILAHGMGEFVAGIYNPLSGGLPSQPLSR